MKMIIIIERMEVQIPIPGMLLILRSFSLFSLIGIFFSIKTRLTNRRQPILAYSTRRKKLPQHLLRLSIQIIINHYYTSIQQLVTPKSNKRKLGGCTPAVTPSANKVIKR